MQTKTQTIQVDEATAAKLEARAVQRGMSVADFVAELANLDDEILADER
jgi:hypothetical protein